MSETTETGPVLDERRRPRFEVRKAPETKAIRDAMRRHHHGEGNSCDWCTEVAVRLVEEVVDPLVTEAERRGEARGAQAERDRVLAVHPRTARPRRACCANPAICGEQQGKHPDVCDSRDHPIGGAVWPCATVRTLGGGS